MLIGFKRCVFVLAAVGGRGMVIRWSAMTGSRGAGGARRERGNLFGGGAMGGAEPHMSRCHRLAGAGINGCHQG